VQVPIKSVSRHFRAFRFFPIAIAVAPAQVIL
jgi:hypothetical protein